MSVTMQFGNVEFGNNNLGGIELVDEGFLSGENLDSIVLDLSVHQIYILFTREITISSGAVRGFRARMFARTENDGTLSHGDMYASSNSGVTITKTDETVTIKPSSTSYDVYYSLYAVM